MKLAILHDFLIERGGAERFVYFLAKRYKADVFTPIYRASRTHEIMRQLRVFSSRIPAPTLPFLKQEFSTYWFANLDLGDNYDILLFNGFYSIFYLMNKSKVPFNILYCNQQPIKIILNEMSGFSPLVKRILSPWINYRIKIETEAVKKVGKFVANSKFTRDEFRRAYKRDSEVVYLPVETSKYKFKDFEDFFLFVGRLSKIKNVDILVKAFKEMPEKKLVIAGEGPERPRLESMASGCSNIQFLGGVSVETAADLYSRCLTCIYLTKNEPLGLVPIEAMASGKPCIVSNSGGVLETIINGKTGFVIEPSVGNLIKTVRRIDVDVAGRMKKNCLQQAKKFDIKVFYKRFDRIFKLQKD
jgi:glycosyltransferase involved in cell wall biosynthesis